MTPRTSRRSSITALTCAAVLAFAASGCAQADGGGAEATPSAGSTTATQPPAGQGALAPFYSQKLTWEKGCSGSGAECSWLKVPIDYDHPDAGSMTLRVLKVPAQGKAKAAMFVNPGGPGGSAVQYASYADNIVTPQIRRDFDIVGVDPRGVGQSQPITCVDDAGVDKMMGADPSPDTPAEADEMRGIAKAFGQACEKKYPKVLGHVSTVDAAKDMDIARAALGQDKLTYLGKSYGTFLGATYAGLFPAKVGRFVLDGAIAPDLTNDEVNLGQAEGFETATRAYVAHCISEGDCPLGNDVEGGMTKLRGLLKSIDANPLPLKGYTGVTELTEGWAATGMARAMYDQTLWDGLTDALRNALAGNGSTLFEMAEQYADRQDNGRYTGNIMQVISAVNCLDRGASPTTFEQMKAKEAQFAKKAPTWGPQMAWGSTTCETWPVKPVSEPKKITADGSGPILVVGTTRDPATPYAWAVRLADQLKDGHLITRDGDGHTGYLMGNECVDKAVDAYFEKGTVPAADPKC